MNKREFKKSVDSIGGALYNEMMTAYFNISGIDKDAVADAIKEVLGATAIAKKNANVFFDRGVSAFESEKDYSKAKNAFFKSLFDKISADFNASIEFALKKFNGALPEEVKQLNKSAVAE